MSWINNAWIVGVGTGILSGLLVTWLLNLFISKKKDREYQQQISSANREIVYSVRSGIPENSMPTEAVIEALVHSTARRYEVDPSGLYQPRELAEELIKEVMDSSFLSAAKKVEYCSVLILIGESPRAQVHATDGDVASLSLEEQRAKLQALRRKASQSEIVLSTTAGLLSALFAGAYAVSGLMPELKNGFVAIRQHVLSTFQLTAVIVVSFSILLVVSERALRIMWRLRRGNSQDRRTGD